MLPTARIFASRNALTNAMRCIVGLEAVTGPTLPGTCGTASSRKFPIVRGTTTPSKKLSSPLCWYDSEARGVGNWLATSRSGSTIVSPNGGQPSISTSYT